MSDKLNVLKPWYHEGLSFKCTGCGKCCTGGPGYVWVDDDEIARFAEKLNISPEDFRKKYTRQVGSRVSLLENPDNYDCIFLKEGKFCSLYDARPKQCRTFPWWPEHLASPEAWEDLQSWCEGARQEVPPTPLEEIEKDLQK